MCVNWSLECGPFISLLILSIVYLEHPDQDSHRGEGVERELGEWRHHDGRVTQLPVLGGDEDEEDDDGDDGEHHHEDADEQACVGSGAVDRVVMRWPVGSKLVG